jgi:hypothetical protein
LIFSYGTVRTTGPSRRARWLVAAGFSVLLASAGCGRDGPTLGRVRGTVTLDGHPLPHAELEFQPQEPGGSPSYGTTDDDGRYTLTFGVDRPGAMVGEHLVRITTFRQLSTEEGGPGVIPERLPPEYNSKSQLERVVETGTNPIDFELSSHPAD